jgi:hypothetical protein
VTRASSVCFSWQTFRNIRSACTMSTPIKRNRLGVSRQGQITKGPGAVTRTSRCPFPHYGYLLIEWYCQNGIPLQAVYSMRSHLIGPQAISAPMVCQRRDHKIIISNNRFTSTVLGYHYVCLYSASSSFCILVSNCICTLNFELSPVQISHLLTQSLVPVPSKCVLMKLWRHSFSGR